MAANFISSYIILSNVYDVKRQSEILSSLQSLQRTTARKVSTSSDKYMRMSTAAFLLSCIPRSLFISERTCMGTDANDNDFNLLDGKCYFPDATSLQQLHQRSPSLSLTRITNFSVPKRRNNSLYIKHKSDCLSLNFVCRTGLI
jgi:hypothetical protein